MPSTVICSGVLIDNIGVLTSGSCVDKIDLSASYVYANLHDKQKIEEGAKRKIKDFRRHAVYSESSAWDFALVFVESFDLNSTVAKIELPVLDDTFIPVKDFKDCQLSGQFCLLKKPI